MSDISNRILKILIDGHYCRETFPILSEWGVMDEDVLMHSIGVSVWTQLGYHLGFMSVCEIPSPGVKGGQDEIRSDSVWFDKETRKPSAIIEFERFNGSEAHKQKLNSKVQNLLHVKNRWGVDRACLVLAYWSVGLTSLPDHHKLKQTVRNGFIALNGQRISGCMVSELLFFHFVFQADRSGQLRLDEIIPRGKL